MGNDGTRVRRYDPCNGDCYGIKRNDADGELMLFEEYVDELGAEATEHERTRALLAKATSDLTKARKNIQKLRDEAKDLDEGQDTCTDDLISFVGKVAKVRT